MNIDQLLAIESIKHNRLLGAKYLDSGRFEELAALYHPEAVCEFGPFGSWTDRSQFAANFAEAAAPFHANGYFSVLHATVNHVVELTGPDTATGLVYLLEFSTGDQLREDGNPLHWLGVYDEEYERVDGEWKIRRQALNFIWPDRQLGDDFLERHGPGE